MALSCLQHTYLYLLIAVVIFILSVILWVKVRPPIAHNVWVYLLSFFVIIGLLIWVLALKPGIFKTVLAIVVLLALAYYIYPLVAQLGSDVWKFVLLTVIFVGLLTSLAFILPSNYFLSWGAILTILLIILLVVGVIGLFLFRTRKAFLIYYLLVIALFSAFVLYNTQSLIQICQYIDTNKVKSDYINLSANLFLDAFNIFLGTVGIGNLT